MPRFSSIFDEKTRKFHLILFVMSAAMPLLILIYILFQHVTPVLTPDQAKQLMGVFIYGVMAMMLFPVLSLIMGYQWVRAIEALSKKIKSTSVDILGDRTEFENNNEVDQLSKIYSDLYGELQKKMVKINEIQAQLMDANAKLREMAIVDELTNLYNRRFFNQRLREESRRAQRYNQELSLIMIDMDDFKRINDTYGHQAGDRLLVAAGNLIRKSIRETDDVFRYGGDEFAALILNCGLSKAEQIAVKLVNKFSGFSFEDHSGKTLSGVTISCGVSSFDGDLDAFITKADRCLMKAKDGGKKAVSVLE